jgi:DNA repair protein RadC
VKIKDFPKDNRPRERFLKQGPEALSDAELFAILLRTGSKGENVIDMSNRLIAEYGLDKLFDCSLKELQEIKGIGPSKAMQILTIAEIQKRINQSKNPVKKISCAEDVFNYFYERLKDEKQENFYILILNNQNNIIKEQLISKGVLDAAILHPREVFKPAIKNSASKIILVHNHPSGNPEPSPEDLDITKQLIDAGKLIDIKILDHVIIGEGKWWSWLEEAFWLIFPSQPALSAFTNKILNCSLKFFSLYLL